VVTGSVRVVITVIRFVLLLGLLLPVGAFAIYKPEYVVLETTGELEIRQYPELIVARTRVEASFEDAGNVAFRRLAGYIFGNNAEKQKISMTAPVTMSPESAGNGAYWVSFFMPAEYQLADLPAPSDGLVEVTRVPAAKMAVLAYKGGWSEEKCDSHKARLMSLLTKTRWKMSGEPIWARYNSPFRPPFMRSNEVMVPVIVPVIVPVMAPVE
jgi:hypothetical protein